MGAATTAAAGKWCGPRDPRGTRRSPRGGLCIWLRRRLLRWRSSLNSSFGATGAPLPSINALLRCHPSHTAEYSGDRLLAVVAQAICPSNMEKGCRMFQKILLIWLAGLLALYAQQPPSAALNGVVRDPSGAVIPNLKVEVRSLERGNSVTAVTDGSGSYAATGLTAGTYSVSVEARGFNGFQRKGIKLTGGRATSLDITLAIDSLRQSVMITSKAPTLEGERETDTRNHQEILEIREVRESSARDVGEALENMEGLWKVRKGGIANDIVLRGFQQDNLNVLIDGVRIFGACPNNMDPPSFHVDFAEVQQVNVLKGPFDIKNQGSLGGVVDIISRTPGRGLEVTPTFATGSFGYFNPSLVASFSNRRFFGLAGYSLRRSRPYVDRGRTSIYGPVELQQRRPRAERLRRRYVMVQVGSKPARKSPHRTGLHGPAWQPDPLSLLDDGLPVRPRRPSQRLPQHQ